MSTKVAYDDLIAEALTEYDKSNDSHFAAVDVFIRSFEFTNRSLGPAITCYDKADLQIAAVKSRSEFAGVMRMIVNRPVQYQAYYDEDYQYFVGEVPPM